MLFKNKTQRALEEEKKKRIAEGKARLLEADGISDMQLHSLLNNIQEDPGYVERLREAMWVDAGQGSSPIQMIKEAVADFYNVATKGISFEQAKLYRIQQKVSQMFREDNLIRAVGMLLQRTVIGSGIRFTSGSLEIDDYLIKVWGKQGCNMESRQKEIGRNRYLLGEYFLVYFIDPTKKGLNRLTVRKFYPWEVAKVITDADDDERFLGVIRKNAKQEEVAYKSVSYYLEDDEDELPTFDEKNVADDTYVQYIKLGDGFDQRGYPQVYVLLKWATVIRELMMDVASKFHEWSKVLYVLTINKKDKNYSTDKARRAPQGGTVVVNTPDAAWSTFENKMDAQGISAVWETLMYYFASGAGFAYQYLVHDYSNNNLASSREARIPLNQLINDQQDSLGAEFQTFFRVAIKVGLELGVIPQTTKVPSVQESRQVGLGKRISEVLKATKDFNKRVEQIASLLREVAEEETVETKSLEVAINFPRTASMSEEEEAKVLKMYRDIGIDLQTITEIAGLDWATIKARKIAELEFQLQLQDLVDQKINQGSEAGTPNDEPEED